MFFRVKWLVLWSLWAARLVRQPTPVRRLHDGSLVRGQFSADGTHQRYSGIPYASSEYKYRFQAPGPAPKWDGVFEAVRENIRCPQLYTKSHVVGPEDCLTLNVYSPNHAWDNAPLPVMVFIHGGGFKEGSGSPLLYGPDYLVSKDVVIVTFNYRLNVHGFLCLGIKEVPGNAGLKDQVAALKWVQRNIRAFGGDPDNVTLFGESAGGVSVSYHLLSPMSKGLFHRAIIQSGSSLAPWALQRDPVTKAAVLAKELGHNVQDPHQLYSIFMNTSLSDLVGKKLPDIKGQLEFIDLHFIPCVERPIEGVEQFLTDTPFNLLSKGDYNKVPVVIGTNNEEGYFLASRETDESLKNINFEVVLEYFDLIFPSDLERKEAAKTLRKLYMGDDEISRRTLLKFSRLHGEPYFNLPGDIETELILKTSDKPVYSYEFQYDGRRNMPKFISGRTFWNAPGATHADELFYLFKIVPIPLMFENKMVETMTTLWTNFAKYGMEIESPCYACRKHIQLNPFIMTSRGNNKHVILSGRHTKHFVQNKQPPALSPTPEGSEIQWSPTSLKTPIRLELNDRPTIAQANTSSPTLQYWRLLYDNYREK